MKRLVLFLLVLTAVGCDKYKYGVRGCDVENPSNCREVNSKFKDKQSCMNYALLSSIPCRTGKYYDELKEGEAVCTKKVPDLAFGECIEL